MFLQAKGLLSRRQACRLLCHLFVISVLFKLWIKVVILFFGIYQQKYFENQEITIRWFLFKCSGLRSLKRCLQDTCDTFFTNPIHKSWGTFTHIFVALVVQAFIRAVWIVYALCKECKKTFSINLLFLTIVVNRFTWPIT